MSTQPTSVSPAITPRPAEHADLEPMARLLANAFQSDLMMQWLFGENAPRRQRRLVRWMRNEVRRHLRHGGPVLTTSANTVGAALWDPPDRWRVGLADVARALPMVVPAIGPRLPRALRGLRRLELAHPEVPHYYLAVLGTSPDRQGQGIGRALLEPGLARCDTEGVHAHLETAAPANLPFYERAGFRVSAEICLPHGPLMWAMTRPPNPRPQGKPHP